nr:MAG: ORF1 [Torque teno midi virus]
MPFWWKRRRKPWYGRFRRRRRFQRYKRRPRRRFARRRGRRAPRRRRKRKVRRKKKKIILQQWQPESIRKCKIIGFSTAVLGGEGRQFLCWTDEAEEYVIPKSPGGGGFGYESISLEWLYSQNKIRNNIWTHSNQYMDLVRYTGGKFKFTRHPTTDFIVSYSIQPPFEINKFSYMELQPQYMLLTPKHRVILSKKSKPTGKNTVTIKFKPPKTLSTRWFFQKELALTPLVLLKATAATLSTPRISPIAQSQMITIYYLDTQLWPHPNWGATKSTYWAPVPTELTAKYKFYYKTSTGEQTIELPSNDWSREGEKAYYASINKDTGWFQKKVLNAYKVDKNQQTVANRPILTARYNPNEDTGQGNEVYALSILQSKWSPPLTQDDYVIRGVPLYLAFFGFYSFLKLITKDKAFDQHYMFVVKCSAIHPIGQPSAQSYFPFLDREFIDGVLPYEEYISENIKKLWYPKAVHQQRTINAFVESGPFVPRYTNITESTWELPYKYYFYFKWGGPQVGDPAVDDPSGKHQYPNPYNFTQTIQISDPKKLATESLLHEWDFRRGIVTQRALKRMSENIETDTDFQSDESGTPKKKRKITKKVPVLQEKQEEIQKCLRSLCEEPTCQETTQDVQQLIKQQQQQQQLLKHNILKLLTHLKTQQRYLSLQTGHPE